jgi:hypothetical protein
MLTIEVITMTPEWSTQADGANGHWLDPGVRGGGKIDDYRTAGKRFVHGYRMIYALTAPAIRPWI